MPILSNLQDLLDATGRAPAHRLGLLGLDVSKKAIGVAGTDPDWQLATPLVTIGRTRLKADLERLRSLLAERAAGALVIGLPLNMDGSEGPRCQAIRQFAKDVDRALNLPILLWDERLTTFAAEERADEIGLKGRKKANLLDAIAAALILEDVLDAASRRH
ncbi:MAG: Holliday junction resolvase RuvX [Pseudomonadota bacterium]